MIQGVSRRYEAYKDSGVEWLGEIPEHWKINHLKRGCSNITDGAHTSPDLTSNDYPFITVVNLKEDRLDFLGCLFTSSDDYNKLVRNGCQPKVNDVLYSKDGTISETVVIKESKQFVVGSSFIIIRPKLKINNSDYLCYLLASNIMRYQASIYVKGASLPRISIFNIAKLISISPSPSEQKAIADYLDTKTAQIDKKVDLLSKKAKHYQKLKQSLINETVTRGLNKNVAMKDSGVEWIGDIPEHWEVMRLKDVATMRTGNSLNDTLKEKFSDKKIDNTPYVATKDIELTTYSANINNGVYIPNSESKYKKAPSYSTLLCVEGGSAGKKMTFVKQSVCYVNKLLCFSNNVKVNPLFLHYFIRSTPFSLKFNTCLTGLKDNYWGVTAPQISRFKLPVPLLIEQKSIADYLDEKTAKIDKIVATINSQIDNLKELRKTLINDVVTGQIKVTQDE